jgi:hypothetical protein
MVPSTLTVRSPRTIPWRNRTVANSPSQWRGVFLCLPLFRPGVRLSEFIPTDRIMAWFAESSLVIEIEPEVREETEGIDMVCVKPPAAFSAVLASPVISGENLGPPLRVFHRLPKSLVLRGYSPLPVGILLPFHPPAALTLVPGNLNILLPLVPWNSSLQGFRKVALGFFRELYPRSCSPYGLAPFRREGPSCLCLADLLSPLQPGPARTLERLRKLENQLD